MSLFSLLSLGEGPGMRVWAIAKPSPNSPRGERAEERSTHMETLIRDIRYGIRSLVKRPGFTSIAVVTLALGIGANTAIFSLVNAVLLKPLSFPDSERLVMVWESFNLSGDGEPEKITAYGVTANLFPLLGIQPALGRNFSPDEDQPGARKVAIISSALWQRRYGGDRSLLERDILLNGEKYSVIGVMPANFQFMQSYVGIWTPAAFTATELSDHDNHYLTVVARMKRGVTLAQAQAEIRTITERIVRDHPNEMAGTGSAVVSLREQLAGDVRRPLMLLLAAVGLVLLISCANIGSLLLSRAAARTREMALRAALGARRWRIVRQLLTESILLSGTGGVLGLLVAVWSFTLLRQLIPGDMRLTTNLKIDLTMLGYALIVSLLTGIIFGLAPALQVSKVDLNQALKQGGGRGGSGGGKLRGVFIMAQVALALVLLVGAGLLMQTVFNLRSQYSAFQPDTLLTLRTGLPEYKYREQPKRVAFYDQVLTRVYNAIHRQVSASFFQAMGVGLRQGRYFDDGDNQQSMPVTIVNETMARQYWSNQGVLGRRFKLGVPNAPWVTIIGVVADVRQMGMDAPVKAEMYFPYRQITTHFWYAPRDLVIRTTGDPTRLVTAARQAIREVDPDQPISNIATMDELLTEETGPRRLGMILLSAFAGLALLLASLGIYGVLSYFVTQQTPEIGVRMALGAGQRNIMGLVLRKGMRWTLPGVAIGLLATFAMTRLIKSLLFGINPTDPVTFAAVSIVLIGVALAACYFPARRATKVDPLVALRYE